MNILFLLPELPFPPASGGRSKAYNLLQFLSRSHQCDILCFGDQGDPNIRLLESKLPGVKVRNCIPLPSRLRKLSGALWNLIRLRPVSLAAYSDKEFARAVQLHARSDKYDVIHYDIINMVQYLRYASAIPSVHSPNDATSLAYSRLAGQLKWSAAKLRMLLATILIRRYERIFYPLFSFVHVVSPVDASYLKCISEQIRVIDLPIMINDNIYAANKAEKKFRNNAGDGPLILCIGNMNNRGVREGLTELLGNVLPEIFNNVPDARLIVLGKGSEITGKKYDQYSGAVKFMDWVDNYDDFLLGADVIIVPDKVGAPGAKTRVINAMGLGLPVVGTPTAFEGIPLMPGKHGIIYENEADCASAVIRLLSDSGIRKEIGMAARSLVRASFYPEEVGPKYEDMYRAASGMHA